MRIPYHTSILLLATSIVAQDSWTLANPTVKLTGRGNTAMAFDSARGVVVLFGGDGGTKKFRDTWEWNGKSWSLKSPKTTPPPLYAHAMAYDSDRKVVVMFGNDQQTGTWEWNGTDWKLAGSVHTNDTRRWSAMAYDEDRKVVVRFGGERGRAQGKTWTWDGKSWKLAASSGPPARYHHVMVWDSIRRRIVMTGGLVGNAPSNDTWEWNGKVWVERKLAKKQPVDYGSSFAFHPGIGRAVLTGGVNKPTETWSYDGNSWQKHKPTGSLGRGRFSKMVYDAKRNEIVLALNTANASKPVPTYIYRAPTKTLAATRTFGTGCAGSAGTPKLEFVLPPYIGAPTSLSLSSLPNSTFSIPFLYVGASDKSWGAITLPWGLGPIGAPKCTTYVSSDILFRLTASSGGATLTTTIPWLPALVGNSAFVQGFVTDRSANALGAAFSNAVAGKIGQRW
jgi:Galactose oxidase, central domain/Kelch motif